MKKKGVGLIFNFSKNKKGLSAVITTIIIIALALVAIGIVWLVVSNLIDTGSEGITFDRFTTDLSITSAYIDGADVQVSVRRSPGGGDINGIEFVFTDGSDSSNVLRVISLQELEQRSFIFTSGEVGGVDDVREVSVAPVFPGDGDGQVGDITDTAQISAIPPPGSGGDGGDGGDGDDGGDGGLLCGNEICDPSETPESCPADCSVPSSCDGIWNPGLEDEGVVCDGGAFCTQTCTCQIGYIPDNVGGCVIEPSLNFGTIDTIWPGGAAKYFDSEDLPKDSVTIVSYIGKYVSFSGAGGETRCLQISYAEFLTDPSYLKSYVRLDLVASVIPGDNYEIWTSPTCGA